MATLNLQVKFNAATVLITTAIIAGGAFGVMTWRDHQRANNAAATQLPSAAVQKTSFSVYAPLTPPAGFTLNRSSVSSTNQAFVYSYTYDKNKQLVITTQQLPPHFDTTQFNPDKTVQTNIGTAYMVDLDARTTAAVVTNKSLIFINAPSKISEDVLEQFINTMELAK